MDTRSVGGGWWIACSVLLALAGCGSDGDTSGNDVRGNNGAKPIPGQPNANAGSSATDPLTGISNPNGPAPPPRTMPLMPDMACASTSIVANRVLPTVMLVVDGSTSMQSGYGPAPDGGMAFPNMAAPGQASRWSAVREALVKPDVGVVPSLQGLVKFGLAVFGTAGQCPLPLGVIDPVINNFMAINSGLPQSAPGMFTPTGPALDQVVDKLPDPTLAVDKVIGPQIIVLATDGEPNACGSNDIFAGIPMTDYNPSIAAAMKAQAKHLKMYVVSVASAGGEFANHLQQMANIGANMPAGMNAPVYYPEDPAALAETLKMLIGDQLSCELALEGKGVKVGKECTGTVELNGQKLPCAGNPPEAGSENGWMLKDEKHIELLGTACETFKNAVDARLSAKFPCEVIITI